MPFLVCQGLPVSILSLSTYAKPSAGKFTGNAGQFVVGSEITNKGLRQGNVGLRFAQSNLRRLSPTYVD
jgi:hypothetical protein